MQWQTKATLIPVCILNNYFLIPELSHMSYTKLPQASPWSFTGLGGNMWLKLAAIYSAQYESQPELDMDSVLYTQAKALQGLHHT